MAVANRLGVGSKQSVVREAALLWMLGVVTHVPIVAPRCPSVIRGYPGVKP
jgi:hypothetical protein